MITPHFDMRGQQIAIHRDASAPSERLDKVLALHLPAYSRTFLQHIIVEGRVRVNGVLCLKPSTLVPGHATLSIDPSQEAVQEASAASQKAGIEQLSIAIVHRSEHFAVLDKPPFLPVHKSSSGSTNLTLVDWIGAFLPQTNGVGEAHRPGIIHRLDKDTSGLIIVATDPRAHTVFSALFKQRMIKKTYQAVVEGLPPAEGVITYSIARHPIHRVKMTHAMHGKDAFTRYRVVRYFEDTALVELFPETGRTHQIRVHCAAIGHPLVGDALYGNASSYISRHALHATELQFVYEQQQYHILSPLPPDMQTLIAFYSRNS